MELIILLYKFFGDFCQVIESPTGLQRYLTISQLGLFLSRIIIEKVFPDKELSVQHCIEPNAMLQNLVVFKSDKITHCFRQNDTIYITIVIVSGLTRSLIMLTLQAPFSLTVTDILSLLWFWQDRLLFLKTYLMEQQSSVKPCLLSSIVNFNMRLLCCW